MLIDQAKQLWSLFKKLASSKGGQIYTIGSVISGIVLVVVGVAIFGAIRGSNTEVDVLAPNKQAVFINERTNRIYQLDLEVASTPAEQEQGLMYRTELAQGHGMLFVFDVADTYTFWMKNTFISLDIIFLDPDLKVVTIYQNALINQTNVTYKATSPAQYVIETTAGWSTAVGLQQNDQILVKNF